MSAPARRRDIQGLRAVAVLLVMAFHAGLPVPGGFLGVDVFFAISGFVITQMLWTELAATGRIDFLRFYARRVKRLLPALALMVSAVAVVGTLAGPAVSQQTTALTGAAASVFGANIYLAGLDTGYFDVSTTFDPFLHTWTLAVEEQFYLLFPAVLLAGWYVGRRTAAATALLAVSVASLALSFALVGGRFVADGALATRLAFYGAPTRAWEFAAGALVALAVPLAARLSPGAARILGLAGLVAIGAAAVRTDATELLAVCGACVVLAAGAGRVLGVSRALGTRPAVWVGDLSYSLYLWHWPLIVFAGALWPGTGWAAPAAAAASFLPARLSYRYVENPIRFNQGIGGRRVAALAAVCVALPLAASGGLLATEAALGSTASVRNWQRSQALHVDVTRGCAGATPIGAETRKQCTWSVERSRGDVVLLGDSNAGHFTEPVIRAGNRAGFDVTVATYAACPPLGLRVERLGGERTACPKFGAETVRRIVASRPSLVIVATRTDKYLEDASFGLGGAESAELTRDAAGKARLWDTALRALLSRLNGAGIPVVLVHPVPALPDAPDNCAMLRILMRTCATSISRSAADARLRRSIELEKAAVADATATWTIDFADALCDGTRCESSPGGRIRYRDPEHLTIDGALTLTDRFFREIVARARPREKGPGPGIDGRGGRGQSAA